MEAKAPNTGPKKLRGQGKKPRKVHVSLRLDKDLHDAIIKKYGKEWRVGITTVLRKHLNLL